MKGHVLYLAHLKVPGNLTLTRTAWVFFEGECESK